MKIQPPRFGPKQERIYGEALDALDRANVRYMLGGTVALNAHTGIWRETKDIDLFVPLKEVRSVLGAFERAAFVTEVTDPHWLAKAWKGDTFVDVIFANQNGTAHVEESWFENAKEAEILGRRVLVIPAEEMLLSKIFVASRNRWDMSDVLHLIFATRGDLDWERILAKVGDHWLLLLAYLLIYCYVYPSHARYVPGFVLETLFDRYGKEAEADDQEPLRFRGTMLDHESFAVDIEEWGLPDEGAVLREAERIRDS